MAAAAAAPRMQGTPSDLLNGQWTLTVFANPQILSLLGQGWSYREILRVNTLSSRRVRVEGLSPRDTVLTLKQKLEDIEGVPVEVQELRRVNLDGATEAIMRDEQQLHQTGVRSGDTVFWVNAKDGDVSLFSAGSNSDGCRMADSAGSEVLTVQEEEGSAAVAEGNWWERSGSSSGVLSRGSGRPLSAARQPSSPATGAPGVAPAPASVVAGDRSDELESEHPSPVERARLVQAAEARAARLPSMHGEQHDDPPTGDATGAARPTLAAGHRVKIIGLTNLKAQHLNGTYGTVLEYIAELQRYHLQLDGGAGKAKLKRDNLEQNKPPARATAGRGKLRGAHHPKVNRREEDTGEVALDVRAMMVEERAKRKSRRHGVTNGDSAATIGAVGQARSHIGGNTGWSIGVSTGTVAEPIDREHRRLFSCLAQAPRQTAQHSTTPFIVCVFEPLACGVCQSDCTASD